MNKYFTTLQNERGDVLPNYRAQVVDNTGAIVTIYEDKSGTRFTDSSGNIVNYASAANNGRVSFYFTAEEGQVLQTLDTAGDLVDSEPDFADNFILGNLPGTIAQDAVTDLTTDLAAKAETAVLASTGGASGIGLSTGRTVEDRLQDVLHLEDYGPDATRAGDSAALKAAIAAANGRPIRLKSKRYYWDSTVITDDFCLIGEQMPRANSDKTALEGGTIIDGGLYFTADNVTLIDLGVDVGSASSATEGDAIRGTASLNAGGHLHTENVVALCKARNSAYHAQLYQSYQRHTGGNLECVYGIFGFVSKSQNTSLTGTIKTVENQSSGFLLKSDTGFGTCSDFYAERVECECHTGQDNGLHIQSSDAALRRVHIGSVYSTGAEINALIQCGASGTDVRDVYIGEIKSFAAFTNDLVLDAINASSAIFNCRIDRLVTNETKAASVKTQGSGGSQLSIGSAFINYRTAAVQTDLDQAVTIGANCSYSNIESLSVMLNYGTSLKGTITYGNSHTRNRLGLTNTYVAGGGSPRRQVYNTTGGTVINIDISECDEVEIVFNQISLSASDKIEMQFSTDDGTTLETGTVYRRTAVDAVVNTALLSANEFLGVSSNTANILSGSLNIKGMGDNRPTMWNGAIGSVADGEARILTGVVNTTTRYKTLQLQAPTGTFDAVDIVVYKL